MASFHVFWLSLHNFLLRMHDWHPFLQRLVRLNLSTNGLGHWANNAFPARVCTDNSTFLWLQSKQRRGFRMVSDVRLHHNLNFSGSITILLLVHVCTPGWNNDEYYAYYFLGTWNLICCLWFMEILKKWYGWWWMN